MEQTNTLSEAEAAVPPPPPPSDTPMQIIPSVPDQTTPKSPPPEPISKNPIPEITTTEPPNDDGDYSGSEPAVKISECTLKDETIFKILDHSVGMITLDCGYHQAHKSCLDVLNDVCCDYIKKISSLLRLAIDTEDLREAESDFVDSLERVFHQINIPSAANLHQFVCKMEAIRKHTRETTAATSTSPQQQLCNDKQ